MRPPNVTSLSHERSSSLICQPVVGGREVGRDPAVYLSSIRTDVTRPTAGIGSGSRILGFEATETVVLAFTARETRLSPVNSPGRLSSIDRPVGEEVKTT